MKFTVYFIVEFPKILRVLSVKRGFLPIVYLGREEYHFISFCTFISVYFGNISLRHKYTFVSKYQAICQADLKN